MYNNIIRSPWGGEMARPPGITGQIEQAARQVLEQCPEGIRYMDLVGRVQALIPEAKPNTIQGMLQAVSDESDVLRPSRGHWILSKYTDVEPKLAPVSNEPQQPISEQTFNEQDFYEPFAEWLWNVEEEVNGVHVVGGNSFKSKWATPDVIGTYKRQSAEIKIDPGQSVTAFGQACAYRLFSHKVYIVMPVTIERVKDDFERLQALCTLFGMGLVLFKPDTANPAFEKRVTARKFERDIFYVNEFARRLRQTDPQTFNRLF
jgi:hypothetical protein